MTQQRLFGFVPGINTLISHQINTISLFYQATVRPKLIDLRLNHGGELLRRAPNNVLRSKRCLLHTPIQLLLHHSRPRPHHYRLVHIRLLHPLNLRWLRCYHGIGTLYPILAFLCYTYKCSSSRFLSIVRDVSQRCSEWFLMQVSQLLIRIMLDVRSQREGLDVGNGWCWENVVR